LSVEKFRNRSRRFALAAVFGVIIFVSKLVIPMPLDKALVIVQALFLALGSLLLGPLGATFVSTVGGLLTAIWRAPFAPFTLAFAILYGVLTDALVFAFKAKTSTDVRTWRLIVAVTVATTVVGLASYYVTAHVLTLLPRNPILELAIIIAGVANGLAGGYLAATIWRKALRHIVWA